VAAASLAEVYGTPLLVLDEEHLLARCREFARAFPRVLYAVKALTSRRLLRLVSAQGLGLLAASGGELRACLRTGVDPTRVALHGNNKSDDELVAAIDAGIGLLICDNLQEIERAADVAERLGRQQDVLVRVIPSVSAGGHSSIVTGSADSRFGLSPLSTDARRAVELIVASRSLHFRGLHCHIGSQILSAEPYLRAINVLVELARQLWHGLGVACDCFDLGGGFGITYRDEAALDVPVLADSMNNRLAAACTRARIPRPQLIVEPGRAIVGNAGVTLYRVGAIKKGRKGTRFVAVDGGMSDNLRPMLYGAQYTIAAALRRPDRACLPATVVGKHCESGDVLADGVRLPTALQSGELLAVAATGAYCYSMANNYNRAPRPAVVAVRAGRAELWLRRETHEDLDRLEVTEGDLR
jgi:diaminopimelate decarboxylase